MNDQGNGRPGLRVLVVDDDADNATLTRLLLQMQGHDVEVAPDGLLAVEKALARWPEIILLDIGLPRLNGYEVARRLRLETARKRPFIIAISGFGGEEHYRQSQEAGIDFHFVKPYDMNHLQQLLTSLGQLLRAEVT